MGYVVRSTASLGKGFPDIIVSRKGINLLVEIKQPKNQQKEPRQLTPMEIDFAMDWPGPYMVAVSTGEITDWFYNHIRREDGRTVILDEHTNEIEKTSLHGPQERSYTVKEEDR